MCLGRIGRGLRSSPPFRKCMRHFSVLIHTYQKDEELPRRKIDQPHRSIPEFQRYLATQDGTPKPDHSSQTTWVMIRRLKFQTRSSRFMY
jgi:hypothetical protein